jgi:hypothetical protein
VTQRCFGKIPDLSAEKQRIAAGDMYNVSECSVYEDRDELYHEVVDEFLQLVEANASTKVKECGSIRNWLLGDQAGSKTPSNRSLVYDVVVASATITQAFQTFPDAHVAAWLRSWVSVAVPAATERPASLLPSSQLNAPPTRSGADEEDSERSQAAASDSPREGASPRAVLAANSHHDEETGIEPRQLWDEAGGDSDSSDGSFEKPEIESSTIATVTVEDAASASGRSPERMEAIEKLVDARLHEHERLYEEKIEKLQDSERRYEHEVDRLESMMRELQQEEHTVFESEPRDHDDRLAQGATRCVRCSRLLLDMTLVCPDCGTRRVKAAPGLNVFVPAESESDDGLDQESIEPVDAPISPGGQSPSVTGSDGENAIPELKVSELAERPVSASLAPHSGSEEASQPMPSQSTPDATSKSTMDDHLALVSATESELDDFHTSVPARQIAEGRAPTAFVESHPYPPSQSATATTRDPRLIGAPPSDSASRFAPSFDHRVDRSEYDPRNDGPSGHFYHPDTQTQLEGGSVSRDVAVQEEHSDEDSELEVDLRDVRPLAPSVVSWNEPYEHSLVRLQGGRSERYEWADAPPIARQAYAPSPEVRVPVSQDRPSFVVPPSGRFEAAHANKPVGKFVLLGQQPHRTGSSSQPLLRFPTRHGQGVSSSRPMGESTMNPRQGFSAPGPHQEYVQNVRRLEDNGDIVQDPDSTQARAHGARHVHHREDALRRMRRELVIDRQKRLYSKPK